MFCKYCGKSIDNDSIYCRYCGRQIGEEEQFFKFLSGHSLPTINSKSYTFPNIRNTKRQLFKLVNFIWKVLKTIVLALVGLIVYILVGFVMSPFIALFNVEIPSMGFCDEIGRIWNKEKNNEKENSK